MNFIIYELYLNKVDKNLIGVEAWGAHLEKALHPLPPSRGGTLLPQGGCASSSLCWKTYPPLCALSGLGNMSIFKAISLQIFECADILSFFIGCETLEKFPDQI